MALPDRPVDGAEIATEWGQEIHDRVFAPKGCIVSGTSRTVGSSYAGLDLSSVTDDPGGFLDAAHDRVEVPTGAEGLYILTIKYNNTGGVDGNSVIASVGLNGTPSSNVIIPCETGNATRGILTELRDLSAGDQLACQARKIGGSDPTVQVLFLSLVRIGAELGA